MNIDKLVAAAKEIDRISLLQEERTRFLQELAIQARNVEPNSKDHRDIINKSRQSTVISYGDAVLDLRKALHSN